MLAGNTHKISNIFKMFPFLLFQEVSFQALGGNVLVCAACPPEGIHHAFTSKWW